MLEAGCVRICRYALAVALALVCVTQAFAQDDWATALANHPMPTDEAGRRAECAWIRNEAARQQNLLLILEQSPGGYPAFKLQGQVVVQNHMAALANHAADVGCTAAFSNTPAPQTAPASSPPQSGMSFDECFQKCKQYTSRTNEECFDSCKGSGSAGSSVQPQPDTIVTPGSATTAGALRGAGVSCQNSAQCSGLLLCLFGACKAPATNMSKMAICNEKTKGMTMEQANKTRDECLKAN